MTRRALLLLLLAACGPKSSGGAPENTPPPAGKTDSAALVKKMLGELHKAAECPSDSSAQRLWCTAADGWATGTPAELPQGEHLLVGLSAGLIEDESVDDALEANVFLAAMGIKNAGGKQGGLITDVNPKGVEEQQMVAQAVAEVTAVLKGKQETARIPAPLHQWLMTIPPAADHALVRDTANNTWRLEGSARAQIRKVGAYWVALELPTEGPPGLFVSIFTDKVEAAPQ